MRRSISGGVGTLALAFMVLMPVTSVSPQTASVLPLATIEKIERVITGEMTRQNIPALSVAVVTNNQLRWSNGYGMSDLENFVPAKSSTVYRLGSISKPITAIAALQLVERKKLDLDVPVQKYCPGFPRKRWPLSARHLLSHLGGVRHYLGDEFLSTRQYNSLTEGLDIFKNDTLWFEPGSRYMYTTYGYNLLGCVVEGAAGVPFMEYLRENIFKPVNMTRMRDDNVNALIPNRAQGYRKNQSGDLVNSDLANMSYKIPGGGLASTVEDLARFAIAVQTGVLSKRETVTLMFTPQKTKDGKTISVGPQTPNRSYGMGWFIADRNGEKEVYHSGSQQRVSTLLYMLPGKGFAVALMSNLEGVALGDLARQIADAVQQ